MEIKAFSGFSKKHNSTKQPSGSGKTLSVKLKENTSVLYPHFFINDYSFSYNYIQWGSRYYFVDDIISISHGMAEYVCSFDALATFKSTIGSSVQYVLRSASSYNLSIIDGKYPTYAYTTVTNEEFDNLHTEFTNGGSFVVAICNGDTVESAGVTYYAIRDMVMLDLLRFLYGGTWLGASDISMDLQKELVNPMQYIDSIRWYPFDIPNSTQISTTPSSMKFGFWDSGIQGNVLNVNDATLGFAQQITIPSHPQTSRGTYLNGNPYTRLMLDCYTFGQIPLDASIFAGTDKLTLNIGVDVLSGIGKMTLRAGSSGNIIFKEYSPVGVEMKISQVTQGLISAPTQILSGAVSMAYGNVLGYAAGVLSAVQSLMPQIATSGTNGTKVSFNNAPVLIISRQMIVDEDKDQFGRPLCSTVQISTLSGFVQCEDADLDLSAAPAEKDAIIGYMNGGFYYE